MTEPTWREKLVCRILLMVARMFAENNDLGDEIKQLATHIGHGYRA